MVRGSVPPLASRPTRPLGREEAPGRLPASAAASQVSCPLASTVRRVGRWVGLSHRYTPRASRPIPRRSPVGAGELGKVDSGLRGLVPV